MSARKHRKLWAFGKGWVENGDEFPLSMRLGSSAGTFRDTREGRGRTAATAGWGSGSCRSQIILVILAVEMPSATKDYQLIGEFLTEQKNVEHAKRRWPDVKKDGFGNGMSRSTRECNSTTPRSSNRYMVDIGCLFARNHIWIKFTKPICLPILYRPLIIRLTNLHSHHADRASPSFHDLTLRSLFGPKRSPQDRVNMPHGLQQYLYSKYGRVSLK